MLTQKLADYFHMTHQVDSVAGAVRIFRTPFCRLPPSLISTYFQSADTGQQSTSHRVGDEENDDEIISRMTATISEIVEAQDQDELTDAKSRDAIAQQVTSQIKAREAVESSEKRRKLDSEAEEETATPPISDQPRPLIQDWLDRNPESLYRESEAGSSKEEISRAARTGKYLKALGQEKAGMPSDEYNLEKTKLESRISKLGTYEEEQRAEADEELQEMSEDNYDNIRVLRDGRSAERRLSEIGAPDGVHRLANTAKLRSFSKLEQEPSSSQVPEEEPSKGASDLAKEFNQISSELESHFDQLSDKVLEHERSRTKVQQTRASKDVDDTSKATAENREDGVHRQFSYLTDSPPIAWNHMNSETSQSHTLASPPAQESSNVEEPTPVVRNLDIYFDDDPMDPIRPRTGQEQEGPSFAPPPLPEDWIAQWDDMSKKNYFVQLSTAKSQWETPTRAAPTGPTPQATPQDGLEHLYISERHNIGDTKGKEHELSDASNEDSFRGKSKGKSMVEERDSRHDAMDSDAEQRPTRDIEYIATGKPKQSEDDGPKEASVLDLKKAPVLGCDHCHTPLDSADEYYHCNDCTQERNASVDLCSTCFESFSSICFHHHVVHFRDVQPRTTEPYESTDRRVFD